MLFLLPCWGCPDRQAPVSGPPHRPAGPRGTSGRDDCGRSRTKQRHNSDQRQPYAIEQPPRRPPRSRAVSGRVIVHAEGRAPDPRHRVRKVSMNQQIADRLHFLRAFAANPRQVGAILPTSRWAVRDMLDLGDVPGADLVVELGAGTGVQTGEILARMRPEARLIALEIDPALVRILEQRFDDPRLEVVCDSAEHLAKHLDGELADVLVCALPFTSLEPSLRRRISLLNVPPAFLFACSAEVS